MTDDKDCGRKKEEVGSDHNSPYYIHASDYGLPEVGFIDGTIKKQESDATYMAWMRCDTMIKVWLHTAMEKDIRTSVKYASTAQEIWADLKERFGKETAPKAYEMKQSLSPIRQDGSSISAYYTKLRALWDEIQSVFSTPICNCGNCTCNIEKKMVELKDKVRLYEFLLGLDSNFGTIRTQILVMKSMTSLGATYHLVTDVERQRAVSGMNVTPR
ncbi:uncharacterized protein LOC110942567 [Helianthus annuus]|uniref:uncharacterized protein LOC110942567 n=1 Tax=Helianthus annuus TaxID=4232 RepID=UPI000B8F6BBA|nr:uncharacterized protein LOC110942567 [Helianthus annuus]